MRGRARRRTSVAALCCYKAGEKSRLIHRPRTHLLLKGARKSFSWQEYRDLLVRAHIQLGGPIVVVWDNLNTHLAAGSGGTRPNTTGSRPSGFRRTHPT